MQSRSARFALVALLAAAGAASAVFSWNTSLHLGALDRAETDVAGRIDVMTAALAELGLAQHGYLALSAPGVSPRELVASLIQQIDTGTAALRTRAQSSGAPARLQAIAEAMAGVVETDARVREYAAEGQTFVASDLLFGAARESLGTAGTILRELRGAEAAAVAYERGQLRRAQWIAVGACAAVWFGGILLLARRPARIAAQPAQPTVTPAPVVTTEPARPVQAVDLATAASVCTDLSRVTTTADLPGILARAATALDARGLIVWMGAGDQLFAAVSHGYDPRMIRGLAPISRSSANVMATAWRTERVSTVPGDTASNGAIAAPMFSPTYCIGVLAAEVPQGRHDDGPTKAVTAMIAAQLATAVAAWPAASASDVRENRVAG